MGVLREWLSNFVNKIKSIFWRKKITEEKSADLLDALTAPEPWHTASGYPYIEGDRQKQPKEITMNTHQQDTPEPTAMAA